MHKILLLHMYMYCIYMVQDALMPSFITFLFLNSLAHLCRAEPRDQLDLLLLAQRAQAREAMTRLTLRQWWWRGSQQHRLVHVVELLINRKMHVSELNAYKQRSKTLVFVEKGNEIQANLVKQLKQFGEFLAESQISPLPLGPSGA